MTRIREGEFHSEGGNGDGVRITCQSRYDPIDPTAAPYPTVKPYLARYCVMGTTTAEASAAKARISHGPDASCDSSQWFVVRSANEAIDRVVVVYNGGS
jgi:hypothetical protein